MWTACPYASPGKTTFPEESVAGDPRTGTYAPTRTGREYPTMGSQRAPDATFFLSMDTQNRSGVEKPCPRHDAFGGFTSGGETFGRRGGVVRSGCSRKFESSSAADSATVGASSHVPSCRPLRSSKTFKAW